MNDKLAKAQAALLALGTVFSWITLVFDYRRFFASGGHLLEISGCAVANPVATPCFYGALAFLAAFAWSVVILRSSPQNIAKRQTGLTWLLSGGTIFAWGNFAYEIYRFVQVSAAPSAFGCPAAEAATHPLLTPCFYGAVIFLSALVVSTFVLRAHRQ